MKLTMTAAAVVFAFTLGAGGSAAQAQQPAGQAPAEAGAAQPSKGAMKAIQEAKAAIDAKDLANIPAKLAAARAVAATPDDRYWVAALEYEASGLSNNPAARAQAIEALLATGKAKPADIRPLTLQLASAYQKSNQADKAASALERVLASGPDTDVTLALAQLRKDQGRTNDAVALLQKNIASATSAGRKPDERLYKHAVQMAYDARNPVAAQVAREWVQAYPSPDSWRNALRIYREVAKVGDEDLVDVLRLHRATGSLAGEADFQKYAYWGITKGFPGEAKAVLDEGFAGNQIKRTTPAFKDMYALLSSQVAADRASLAASATKARSSGTAKQALATADAYYGYGDYAKAADLYRATLAKPGADKNLINLRLGMALARAGDKAGATAALNAVAGPRAELAKFWLAYLATRA